MTKLSIIIPVYNGGDHIERTMENIHAQTFSDYELILVDNNSTDDGIARARAKAEELGMDAVIFAREETPGPSAARNEGLRLAKGEYVMFLDADDEQRPEFFRTMVQAMEPEESAAQSPLCMAACGYEVVKDGRLLYDTRGESGRLTVTEMAERLFDTTVYQGFIWDKIFRRDVIEAAGLTFAESIFYNEDRLFVFEYLMAAKGDARILPDRMYRYILRTDSAMGCVEAGQITERIVTEFDAFERMLQTAKERYGTDAPLTEAIWQDDIKSQLRTFRRILSNQVGKAFAHRSSHLRKYAGDTWRMLENIGRENGRDPRDLLRFLPEHKYLLWGKYMQYAKFGISYTRNPDFFD